MERLLCSARTADWPGSSWNRPAEGQAPRSTPSSADPEHAYPEGTTPVSVVARRTSREPGRDRPSFVLGQDRRAFFSSTIGGTPAAPTHHSADRQHSQHPQTWMAATTTSVLSWSATELHDQHRERAVSGMTPKPIVRSCSRHPLRHAAHEEPCGAPVENRLGPSCAHRC